jgi:hypothetical protein
LLVSVGRFADDVAIVRSRNLLGTVITPAATYTLDQALLERLDPDLSS